MKFAFRRVKKLVLVVAMLTLLLCGCSSNDYKTEIFSLVEENNSVLTEYVVNNTHLGTVTDDLSNLNVQEIEIDENKDIIVFEVHYTGLFDGGVEYGFYYTATDEKLYKNFSSNDYMVIEKILDNWYYYEWHNG